MEKISAANRFIRFAEEEQLDVSALFYTDEERTFDAINTMKATRIKDKE